MRLSASCKPEDLFVSRSVVAAAGALCLAGYVFIYTTGRADQPIRSDGFSYYVYLPSWFIFHDTTLSAVARDCCGGEFPAFAAIIRWPGTRRWVNAHPIGVALMQAPLFLVAHGLTIWTNLSPDGFTLYYQQAVGLSGLAWTIAGLWVLRRLLLRHFTDGVTTATLIAILLGTNLYHYATFDNSYSHAYSFFLFAAFLDLHDRWTTAPSSRGAWLLGVVSGLIVLTRHTNILLPAFFLLFGLYRSETIRRWRDVVKIGIAAAIVIVPQLAIYYRATGRILVSSYGDLGFHFGSPQLFGVLFSVTKGVFFWSPILLFAVAGLAMGSRHTIRRFVLPGTLFLIVNTYIIASWWDWQFGGSYGHRGFVDSLPIFALGLATFFEWSSRRRVPVAIVAGTTCIAVALSMIQMIQYWNRVLPMSDLTWDQYRSIFLRLQ
jgi:hypothetical protein